MSYLYLRLRGDRLELLMSLLERAGAESQDILIRLLQDCSGKNITLSEEEEMFMFLLFLGDGDVL